MKKNIMGDKMFPVGVSLADYIYGKPKLLAKLPSPLMNSSLTIETNFNATLALSIPDLDEFKEYLDSVVNEEYLREYFSEKIVERVLDVIEDTIEYTIGRKKAEELYKILLEIADDVREQLRGREKVFKLSGSDEDAIEVSIDIEENNVHLRPIHVRLHETFHDAIAKQFKELDGERPSLDEIIEEAKRRAEKLADNINAMAYQLIIYDMYSDSFAEYNFIEETNFKIPVLKGSVNIDVNSIEPILVKIFENRPKVYTELLIVDPIEVAFLHTSESEIEEQLEEVLSVLDISIEAAKRAKKALEAGKTLPSDLTAELPTNFTQLNPYVSSVIQRMTAKASGMDPIDEVLVRGTGVVEVRPTLATRPEKIIAGYRAKITKVDIEKDLLNEVYIRFPVIFNISPLF